MIENAAPEERLAAAQERRKQLELVATRLQKLTVGLAGLTITDSKVRRLTLLKSATSYVDKIRDDGAPGMKKALTAVTNELSSLRDGVKTGEATIKDMTPVSVVAAEGSARSLIAKIDVLIAQLEAGSDSYMDQNEKTIVRNREFREKLPNLTGSKKEFAIGRMPIAFTFQNKQGHSSVGYVSLDALDMVGFKAENVAGYTIIHNQLVIGINTNAIRIPVFDVKTGEMVLNEKGEPVTEVSKTTETVVKYKDNKPIKVKVRRPKELKDVALAVLRDLNRVSKLDYAFVSDRPVGANGAGWFWVMPAADIRRLSKAMPGNHVGIAKWGFGS